MSETRRQGMTMWLSPFVGLVLGLGSIAYVAVNSSFAGSPTFIWALQLILGGLGLLAAGIVRVIKPEYSSNAASLMFIGFFASGFLDVFYALLMAPTMHQEALPQLMTWGWALSRSILPVMLCIGLWANWRARRGKRVTSRFVDTMAATTLAGVVFSASILAFWPEALPPVDQQGELPIRPLQVIPGAGFSIAFWMLVFFGRFRSSVLDCHMLGALLMFAVSHSIIHPLSAEPFDSYFVAAKLCEIDGYIFMLGGLLIHAGRAFRETHERQKQRERAIVDTALDGIVTFDGNGVIESFNPAALKMIDGTGQLQDLRGMRITDFTPESSWEKHGHLLKQAREDSDAPATLLFYETLGMRHDGTTFPMECNVNGVNLGQENVWFTAILRDVSERNKRRAHLEAVHERLGLALQSAGLGSWELVVDTGEVIWDQAMFAIFNKDPATYMPQLNDWIGFTAAEYVEPVNNAYQKAKEQRGPFSVNYRVELDNGDNRWINTDGKYIAGDGQNSARLVGVTRDITDSLEALQKIETARKEADEANRAKSAFLATMSHEIRTPLNGVIGLTEVLQEYELPSDQQELTHLIGQSAHSLMDIIEDILDFSKIEAGKLEVDPVPIQLPDIVDEVCGVLDKVAQSNEVKLTHAVDPKIPSVVKGDDARLRQVLNNLLSNAIKFSSKQNEEGRISFTTTLRKLENNIAHIDFVVSDNGIGMDEETQSRLFSPFTQADASTSRRFGGTGLGLTISQRLANLMGGGITVSSQLGYGATFTLSLPYPVIVEDVSTSSRVDESEKQRSAEQANKTAPSRAIALANHQLILVAEDNVTNQEVIKHQLSVLGYCADIANDGNEALSMWRSGDYSLLITDIQMPVMDGYELVRTLRAEEDNENRLPIIALTANTLMEEAENCKAAGADDYMTKPASLESLQEMLETWLATPIAKQPPAQRGLAT